MNVRDLVTGSMRLLGVLRQGENPTAQEAADGMISLNGMLNAWILQGIDLEFLNFASLNDVIPYPDDHIPAFRYNLAVELAPECGVTVTPAIGTRASQYFQALQVFYSDPDTLEFDSFFIFQPNRRFLPQGF